MFAGMWTFAGAAIVAIPGFLGWRWTKRKTQADTTDVISQAARTTVQTMEGVMAAVVLRAEVAELEMRRLSVAVAECEQHRSDDARKFKQLHNEHLRLHDELEELRTIVRMRQNPRPDPPQGEVEP